MYNNVHMTNGLILDPFSIHATGIMRAHTGVKSMNPSGGKSTKLFDGLHGEARFKQAFINCCHFAESMTVVGPVAQLVWDKESSSVIENAVRWQASMMNSGNGNVFQQFEEYCQNQGWSNIPEETWKGEKAYLLNVLPDLSLKKNLIGDEAWMSDYHSRLNYFLYNERYGIGATTRDLAEVNGLSRTDAMVQAGSPVLGLMAVTFTFKKPTGSMSTTELVNLGSWPPVTFLIPSLLPASATIQDRGAYEMRARITNRQPSISSYRISLGPNDDSGTIVPFGQPYRLSSVPKEGKRPDILRSLSDVFKALWSQAAQYSAWNMTIPWEAADANGNVLQKQIGDMSLDPLGAGRRIRGHNRYMSKYDIDNFSMIWEEGSNNDNRLVGWNLDGINKGAWNRQMRSGFSGKTENIFVLPSYFTERTGENLYPVALALARFGMVEDAGIEDFLDGGILSSVQPANHLEENSVAGNRTRSFTDLMTETIQGTVKDVNTRGAIPVHRVEAEIAFDEEGDPTVFGLVMNGSAKALMRKHNDAILDPAERDELLKEVDRLGNFQFLDAICSKNTKDLTDTFKAVKAKGISTPGTKAAALLDDELAIDLFGSDSTDGMLE
jgi:hypothetical protein